MKFGIPYMGSKSSIAKLLCRNLPPATHFYDLFGGGFAITHAMLLLHPAKYKHFHFNEIQSDLVDLIRRAIAGEFNYERFKPPFISREEFFQRKDACPYTRLLWSFGNNSKGYLFSKEIEPYKRSLHNAIVFNEFDDVAKSIFKKDKFDENSTITQRRLFSRRATKTRACELQRLEQLEQLQRLEQLELTSMSYEAVEIKPNSVVYCDPPYAGTAKYLGDFDSRRFWEWAKSHSAPIFISEYSAPIEFRIVLSVEKKTRLSSVGMTHTKNEILFANKSAISLLHSMGVKTFENTGARRARN